TYKWSGAVGASGSQTVTATNNASLTSTSSFTVTPDTSNPSGGALTVNATAASSGGSNSTTSDPTFTISSRSDYVDSGSGIGSRSEERRVGKECRARGRPDDWRRRCSRR